MPAVVDIAISGAPIVDFLIAGSRARERPERGQRREREREKENGWLQKTKGVRRRRNSSASLARTEREEGTWGHSNMTSAQRGKGRYTKRDDSTDRLREWHMKEPKNLPYMSIPRSSTSFHTLPFPPPSRMMDCT